MSKSIASWFRLYSIKIVSSIAFYPALMAFGFLLLSWGMLEVDFSPWGKDLKTGLKWLRLKDATTARSIIATVAGAVISLTVFSFSMVMIVLNQAASQMSNRVLTSMIQNRFQQLVLGFYIGTIVYALFLLSTIRDTSNGVYIPALSIYLLILFTVVCIFLFIYFLDYVTRTVKFETVIERVMKETFLSMKKHFTKSEEQNSAWLHFPFIEIKMQQSNYFQSFDNKAIIKLAASENIFISFLYPQSTFLIEGVAFMRIYAENTISEDCKSEILSHVDFYSGQPIDVNADYGFRQLSEIAIKALSPGINDPGTAVIALQAIASLLCYRLNKSSPTFFRDDSKIIRIDVPIQSLEDIFEHCIDPIWSYGKEDLYIQKELLFLVKQLKEIESSEKCSNYFDSYLSKIQNLK